MVMDICPICGANFDRRGHAKTCSKECSAEAIKRYQKQYKKDNAEAIKQYRKQYYRDNAEYFKQYRKDNAEAIKRYKQQYRKDNAEAIKQYRKQYYQDNAEAIKEYQKQYYRDNAEYRKQYDRQYYRDNAEYFKQYKKQYYEKTYVELSKQTDISVEDLKKCIPPMFILRELDCWDHGSYFLDFICHINERANGKCELTGKKSSNLEIHHLNGYNWCIEGRMDPANAICIDKAVHKAFHDKYGYGDNTSEQWNEFVSKLQKGTESLDNWL